MVTANLYVSFLKECCWHGTIKICGWLCAVIDKVLVLLLVNVSAQRLHRYYQKYVTIMTYCCPLIKLWCTWQLQD